MAGKVATAYVDTELDPTGVKKGLAQIEGETKRRMGGIGSDLKKGFEKAFVPALAGFAAVALGAKKAVDSYSDLNEQVTKSQAVFKDASGEIIAWSQTTAKSIGVSQRAALEAAGTFGNMLVPMGFARKEAAGMSKRMVQLGADMASFNNASPEETLDAIRAGLAGETEPLRRFGVFLSQARIEQEALNLGLIKGAGALKTAEAATASATAALTKAQRDSTAANKALTAAKAENAAAAKALTAAERASATAQHEVTAATSELEQAQKRAAASTAAVGREQERVRDAAERLADARDRSQAAAARVADAEQNLATTQGRVKVAQEALTQARLDAIRALSEMGDSAKDAALGEQRATIALARARERAAAVAKDGEATELDREDAALSVAEAERSLEEAQQRRTDTTKELADAEAKGVEGSDQVTKARQGIADAESDAAKSARVLATEQAKLADAGDTVRDSARGLATAQRSLRDAQREARQSTADVRAAQHELTAAQAAGEATAKRLQAAQAAQAATAAEVTKAQNADTAATDRLHSAQTALTAARKREQEIGKKVRAGLTAEQKARATYSLILKDTKDAQGDVIRTGQGLANTQRRNAALAEDAAAKVGKGLTPAYLSFQHVQEKVFRTMGEHAKLTQTFMGVFAALTGIILAVNAAMKAYAAWQAISKALTKLQTRETGLNTLALKAQQAWTILVSAATKAWTAVQWLLNAALAANPIGLVVVALAALAAALVIAYKKSDTFREIVDKAFAVVTETAQKFADFFTKTLPAAFDYVIGWAKRHWPEIATVLAGPFAPLVLLATDGFGIRSKLIAAFKGILSWLRDAFDDFLSAGKTLGTKLRDGVVDGLKGIALAAWGVIDNIFSFLTENATTIATWGASVATSIKSGVVEGLKGIALDAWGVIDNIGEFITENAKTVIGWGKDLGGFIKQGIVAALSGLKGVFRKLLNKALPGPLEKFNPFGRAAAAAETQTAGLRAAGAQATSAASGGGLAGPVPVGYQLRRVLSDLGPSEEPEPAPLTVRVFIGERELTQIVRTEVVAQDTKTAQTLLAGVR